MMKEKKGKRQSQAEVRAGLFNKVVERNETRLRGESWSYWKTNLLSIAPSTRYNYILGMEMFFDNSGIKDTEELYSLQNDAIVSRDRRKRSKIPRMVVEAIIHYQGLGKSTSHTKSIKQAVTSFMHSNGFEDFRVKVNGKSLTPRSGGGSKIISPKDLDKALMNEKNAQTRALVYTLRDSGLRIGDIISLDYGDLKEGIESNQDFFYISTLTQKTHTQAQTCLGYDSLNALREWIRIRRKRGHVFRNSTPVFIAERVSRGQTRKTARNLEEFEAEISEMRTVETNASNKVIRFFNRSGFKGVSAHGLRKLHSSYLSVGEDRLSEPMIARLEGRTIADSREAYKLYTPEQLIEAYSKAYHLLRGQGDTKSLKEQQEEIEVLKQQIKSQRDQLIDALYMISTASPEKQLEMLERLKKTEENS
jgi:integrase